MSRLTGRDPLSRNSDLATYSDSPALSRVERLDIESIPTGGRSLVEAAGSSAWGAWRNLIARPAYFATTYDPNWRMDETTFRNLTNGLPESYWGEYRSAMSEEHAWFIRNELLERVESRDQLSRAGWAGTALEIGANVFDPVFLTAGIATGGAAAPWIYGTKAARLGTFVRGGLVAGATDASLELVLQNADPERDWTDVLYSGIGSFALGGAADALVKGRITKAARNLEKELAAREIVDAGFEISDEGKQVLRPGIDPAVQRQVLDDAIAASDLDDETAEAVRRAGAVETPRIPDPIYNGADLHFHDVTSAPEGIGGGYSLRATLLSENAPPSAREAGSMLLGGSIARKDGSPSVFGAIEWVDAETRSRVIDFQRELSSKFDEWAKAHDVPWTQRWSISSTRAGFNEQVGDAIRAGGHTDPVVAAMADSMRPRFANMNMMMKRYNVPGFADVPDNPNYLPRLWKRSRLDALVHELGPDAVATVIARSILKNSDAMDDAVAFKIGKGMLKTLQRLGTDDDLSFSRMFSVDQTDALERILRADTTLTDAEIEQVLYRVAPGDPQKGVPARARRRVDLDETYFDEEFGFGIADMLERNVETIYSTYVRQMMGHAAISEVHRASVGYSALARPAFEGEALRPGSYVMAADRAQDLPTNLGRIESIDPDAGLAVVRFANKADGTTATKAVPIDTLTPATRADEWAHVPKTQDDFIKAVKKKAEAQGKPLSKRDETLLRVAHNLVMGKRLDHFLPVGPELAEVLRLLRNINYLRVGGLFGFAQLAELGNAVNQAGFVAMTRQMPILGQIFRKAKNGQLSNDLLRTMESITGTGADMMMHQVHSRLDFGDGVPTTGRRGRLESANRIAQQGGRFLARASGLAPLTEFLHRYSSAAIAQRWLDMGRGRRILSDIHLAQIGLTPERAKAVMENMAAHSTREGKRLINPNIEKWTPQAASDFIVAVNRQTRLAVQANDLASLPAFLTTDVGRTMIQFRSFMLAAWDNQFRTGVQRIKARDFAVFQGWAVATFAATLGYIGKTYADSLGKPDAKERIDKAMTMERIAAAAFARAGYSSIIPAAIDTVTTHTGHGQIFGHSRTSGLAGSLVTGNPTVDLFNSASSAFKSVLGTPTEGFSRQDAEKALRILPFQNTVGLRNVINAIAGSLPDEVPENREP